VMRVLVGLCILLNAYFCLCEKENACWTASSHEGPWKESKISCKEHLEYMKRSETSDLYVLVHKAHPVCTTLEWGPDKFQARAPPKDEHKWAWWGVGGAVGVAAAFELACLAPIPHLKAACVAGRIVRVGAPLAVGFLTGVSAAQAYDFFIFPVGEYYVIGYGKSQ